VTGAAGGQGVAVCKRFVEEGASVLATDIDERALEQLVESLGVGDKGGQLETIQADVASEEEIQAVVAQSVSRFGGLDILYNNAAVRVADRDAPTAALDVEIWDITFAINARGAFLFCKHALPQLLLTRDGVIINVSSVAGYRGDTECHAYSATKGALIALTMSLAQTYGPQGVRVLALCPGFIATSMVSGYLDDAALRDEIVGATALRRIGEPADIANVAAFLASCDAGFMTSVIVPVHGGLVK
jgi:NAD(P)-dependent dehydrogenase (short-subunit alcohol dehydrogenase family)